MALLDLSHPLTTGMPVHPGDPEVRAVPAATLERDGCNVLAVGLGSHTGTHLDAPFHVHADGARLDELPLELLTGPAVVVDVQGCAPGSAIGWEHLAPHAGRLRPGVVVLLHTGWSARWGEPRYFADHPWLTTDAARRIVAAGVRVLGVDTASPDPAGSLDVHRVVLGAGGVIVENLTGLARLATLPDPHVGFFPLPLAGADGAPVRALAWPGTPAAGQVDMP
ncbi:cyclase family protein [Kineococcus xinjiangensis]|uniref:cyclase family protein n=1 Tax=Kineococcus xinjiangensis TaxID=512762 RepID=UPI000CEBCAFF|nr:cyclase family protein [Kineococcus xinjiangensis]